MFRAVTAAMFALCLLPSSLFAQESIPLSDGADVRLLIDISGSMKKNDPINLRVPALKLIAQLLPEGQRASVWTFGRQVNALVPPALVDSEWRQRTLAQAEKINSVALFTNIGGVLETASADLTGTQSGKDVHFILLTDGMVDISEDAQINAAERARILEQVIHRLKELGIRVHTVALSNNADVNLMDKLALTSGGISAVAESPEDLSRIFVQALDQATTAEQVPLTDNAFHIDEAVEEFTALVFSRQDALPVRLIAPNGQPYAKEQHPPTIRWYQDHGYDLITVNRPEEGEWKLEADPQPGSRVTVVTDLRMVVNSLPASFFPGDELEVQAGFYEKEHIIRSADFLGVIDVDVTITNEENLSGTRRISVPGQSPEDGLFREPITKLNQPGRYLVTVKADGKTFQRQHQQVIQLRPQLDVELEGFGSGDESLYRLNIIKQSASIQADQTQVQIAVDAPDGSKVIKTLTYREQGRGWDLDITPFAGAGSYRVQVSVDGTNTDGRSFSLQPDPLMLEFPRGEGRVGEYRSVISPADVAGLMDVEAETASVELQVQPEQEDAVESENQPATEAIGDQTDADNDQSTSWAVWAGIGLGVVVVLGGGIAMLAVVRRRQEASDSNNSLTIAGPDDWDVSPPEDGAVEEGIPVLVDSEPEFPSEELNEAPSADLGVNIVDGRSPEEIADAILAENQLYQAVDEEEFGLEDLDISENDSLRGERDGEDNKQA